MKLALLKNRTIFNRFSFICFGIYFLLEFFIAYHQVFKNYPSDLLSHIAAVAKIGKLNFPQMGFEYTLFLLSHLTRMSVPWSAIIFLSFCIGTQALITYFFLVKLAKVEGFKGLLFTLITLTLGALYIPAFNYPLEHTQEFLSHYFLVHPYSILTHKLITFGVLFFAHYMYVGIGSPNVWHSPTLIVIKMLASVIIYLYITRDNLKANLLITGLLFISCFYKPSFATIFIPALITYELIARQKGIFSILKKIGIIIMPSIVLLGVMYFVLTYIYKVSDGQHTHVILDPFGVIHLYVKNAFIAFIQALAFPLLILGIRFKEIMSKNEGLVLSWLMLIFGYLFFAFLAQSGPQFVDGNFGWGYELGLSFVFIFSMIEYLRYAKSFNQPFLFYFVTVMLVLHVLSGAVYFGKILLTGSFY